MREVADIRPPPFGASGKSSDIRPPSRPPREILSLPLPPPKTTLRCLRNEFSWKRKEFTIPLHPADATLRQSIYLKFKQMAWPSLWKPNALPAASVALPLNPGIWKNRKPRKRWPVETMASGNDDTTPIYDPPPLEAVPKQLIYDPPLWGLR